MIGVNGRSDFGRTRLLKIWTLCKIHSKAALSTFFVVVVVVVLTAVFSLR